MERHTKTMIITECSRAFREKGFWLSLCAGMAISLKHAFTHLTRGSQMMGEAVGSMGAHYTGSAYGQWMAMDISEPEIGLFLFLVPLLATLPYAMSYNKDRSAGYYAQLVSRGGLKEYLIGKYVAVFVSGFIVVVIPLLINFLLVTLDTPLRVPLVISSSALGTREFGLIKLYFHHPLLFTLFYIFLDGLWGGVFALASLIAAGFHMPVFTVWATPMLLALGARLFLVPLRQFKWIPYEMMSMDAANILQAGPLLIEIGGIVLLSWIAFVVKESRI